MATATLSVAKPSIQANGKGFGEFSGLRNSSTCLPFARRTSDDFLSIIAFQTSLPFVSPPSFFKHVLWSLVSYLKTPEIRQPSSIESLKVGSNGGYKKGIVEAKLKVAINGFGRIGRNFLRCWHGRKDSPLDVIAINDTGGVKQASHLLKYDSTLGIFEADVKPAGDEAISVDGKIIKVVSSRNPLNLP